MGKYQREKGKRGEREAAYKLTEILDVPVRRSLHYKGTPESADLAGLDGLHIEVKRTERLSLYQALDQASSDAGDNTPIVMHRRNRKRWVVIFYLDDLLDVVKEINRIWMRAPISGNAKQ